jgi:hypothetical protein
MPEKSADASVGCGNKPGNEGTSRQGKFGKLLLLFAAVIGHVSALF